MSREPPATVLDSRLAAVPPAVVSHPPENKTLPFDMMKMEHNDVHFNDRLEDWSNRQDGSSFPRHPSARNVKSQKYPRDARIEHKAIYVSQCQSS